MAKKKTIKVPKNITYAESNASWCRVSPTSHTGNGTLTVTVDENPSETDDRTATITLMGEGVENVTISLTQRKHGGSTTVSLDDYLTVYNNRFFNASDLTYPIYEPIQTGTAVYNLLQTATTYYNTHFDEVQWTQVFEDQMEVNQGYEVTEVDKGAGFGWFLSYLLTALYPFTYVSGSKTRNGRIFEIAFENYSEVSRSHAYSAITDSAAFLKKHAGCMAASAIFAKMMCDTTFRSAFKNLKETTYTTKCLQDYYFNDGEKFLYEDMYAPKGEEFFPYPPSNSATSDWIMQRDMRYHDVGGQLRATTATGQSALDDRNTKLAYYLDMFTGISYSTAQTIARPSSVSKTKIPDWHNAENGDYLGYQINYLGYDRTNYQKYCLMDLSRKSANRVVQRIKAAGDPGEPYNRMRPFDYLSNDSLNASYPQGGYNNGQYYYDNDTATAPDGVEVTSSLSGTTSYPSGHTACGWGLGLVYCTAFSSFASNTDDFQKLFRRAYQYGESRVIVGAHWQQCVDTGRIAAACAFAMMCANKYFIEQIDLAQAE